MRRTGGGTSAHTAGPSASTLERSLYTKRWEPVHQLGISLQQLISSSSLAEGLLISERVFG